VSKAPWGDCKVAFGIDNADPFNNGALWRQPLPPGWKLDEIDMAGARSVAVFRVKGIPTSADGATVKRWLRKVGAIGR
jgi:hypothetical protein